MSHRYASILGLARQVVIAVAIMTVPASAQQQVSPPPVLRVPLGGGETVPGQMYLRGFIPFHEGDFSRAFQMFRSAFRGGIRSTEGRWIDSICYYTMIGECHYQAGNPAEALKNYDAALNLFQRHHTFMLRLEFEGRIVETTRRINPPINWGESQHKNKVKLGLFPEVVGSQQGSLDPIGRIQRQGGGVVTPAHLRTVRANEIARCTALAMARRAELLGPVGEHDLLTRSLIDALTRRPAIPNHWTQSWIDCLLGLAYVADGKFAQAVTFLKRSQFVGGQFVHPLTGIAQLQLGRISLLQGEYTSAMDYLLEATYSGAAFDQYSLMEEAFRLAGDAHCASGQASSVFLDPFLKAAPWARRRSRYLETSLALSAAENNLQLGNLKPADTQLKFARKLILRERMQGTRVGLRFQFLSARADFESGNTERGEKTFRDRLSGQRQASSWLLQVALADSLYTKGKISERSASQLYEIVLREPTSRDWVLDPADTLAYLTAARSSVFENWLGVALNRKEHEKAIEIADRTRRHRFLSSLPMGGRLLAWRWNLAAPEEVLDDGAKGRRRDLLTTNDRLAKLTTDVTETIAELRASPLVSEDREDNQQQLTRLKKLFNASETQEAILRQLALRRLHAEPIFPPITKTNEIKNSLPDRKLMLIFFQTERELIGFALDKSNYATWTIDTKKLRNQIGQLLRLQGNYDGNAAIGSKELTSASWKKLSEQLLAQVTNATAPDAWGNYDEVVIVPDGLLWYLPFEALQVPLPEGHAPLISKVRIRYTPFASLAFRAKPAAPAVNVKTAVVLKKLSPREPANLATDVFDQLQAALPGTVELTDALSAPSNLLRTMTDRLVVLSDLPDTTRLPYDWAPMDIDRGKRGSTLGSWLALPLGSPREIILPGFHTAAEASLKNKKADGHEVFRAACGLLAGGTQTILLSRWRTGGQSSYDLIREFVQELPHSDPSDAWKRSIELTMVNDLDPSVEPRVDDGKAARLGLKTDHPFFWSGYMLIDAGQKIPDP